MDYKNEYFDLNFEYFSIKEKSIIISLSFKFNKY